MRYRSRPSVPGGVGWGVLIVSLLLLSPPAGATVHLVGSPGLPTIQAGMDSAASGDTVLVPPGTWKGPGNRDLDPSGKWLVIRTSGGAQATTIDCEGWSGGPHRGFLIDGGEHVTVEGFTITHGFVSGGFFAGTGGALRISGGSLVEVYDCDFVYNRTDGTASGGAIAVDGSSQLNMARCRLLGNSGSSGGGLSLISSLGAIADCLFAGNRGGGLFVDASTLTLNGSTITHNSTEGVGGGVFSISRAFVQFNWCLIWDNCAGAGSPRDIYVQLNGEFHFDYCDLDTTGTGVYWDGATIHSYDFTIAQDPLFCAPATCTASATDGGDYHLAPGSPCLPASAGYLIGALGEGCSPLAVGEGDSEAPGPRLLAFPNPSRGPFRIQLQGAALGPRGTVDVVDLSGRILRSIRMESAEALWDGTDSHGNPVISGVYFLRVSQGKELQVVRSVVLNR